MALEDGVWFEGEALTGAGTAGGELVFTTGMAGYQEVITDPSYHGQIITYTFPLVGNYGVDPERDESAQAHARAIVAREITNYRFNFASSGTWLDWLAERNVLAVSGVDTRALTRHIRDKGALRAVVSTEALDVKTLVKAARGLPSMTGSDLAKAVTRSVPETDSAPPHDAPHVLVYDFGVKRSILRHLRQRGLRLTLVPAQTSAREALRLQPDGVFLSNGPGDPAAMGYAVKAVGKLLGRVPIFGICLGHQILAQALGLRTYKLKFGHRGCNHPVKDLDTGVVEITTQNHGFAVRADTQPPAGVRITHRNLNDDTVEGLRCDEKLAFSVQYHPESSPGPHDSTYLFDRFTELVVRRRAGAGRAV